MGLPLPAPGPNRGYDPVDRTGSFWASVWLGGAKFAHTAYARFDEVLREIFNVKRIFSSQHIHKVLQEVFREDSSEQVHT